MTIENVITIITILLGTAGVGGLITSIKTKKALAKSKAEEDKIKADAAQVIVDAAADQVRVIKEEADRARGLLKVEQAEATRWKDACNELEGKIKGLGIRVDLAETCQTTLSEKLAEQQEKLNALEIEKASLMGRIIELEAKILDLQEENKRLKEGQDNEKAGMA